MQSDPTILPKLVTQRMPFGKYKDTIICNIPVSYLEWMASKGFPKGELGMMLNTIYVIKINGLEDILTPFKKEVYK